MTDYSVLPDTFKDKDPRHLVFHYPNFPVVKYAKIMQDYCFYKQLQVAEDVARKQGYILVPFSCMHWQRKKQFGQDRKIKIGRDSFFMMNHHELTQSEKNKLENYLKKLRGQETA